MSDADSYHKPKLGEWSKQYHQDSDTCDTNGSLQFLRLCMVDGGGGEFYVLESERWAFECVDDIVRILTDAGIPQKMEAAG